MFVDKLKDKNVKFNKIDEKTAELITQNEFSQYRLLCLSNVFDKYTKTENAGKYINLDFAQLYYLSKLDEKLSHILIQICLELELKMKTLLICDANKLGVSNAFLVDYIKDDFEFLSQSYLQELNCILESAEKGYDGFALERFLDIAMFGTFEKIVRAFYKRYSGQLMEEKIGIYDGYLISIHNLRNKVAHNIPLLGDLHIKGKAFNSRLSAYLVKSGIKNKTLHTNLSREVEYDIVNVLYFYCCIQDRKRIITIYRQLKEFCRECKQYAKYLINNSILVSTFNFFERIIKIFRRPVA